MLVLFIKILEGDPKKVPPVSNSIVRGGRDGMGPCNKSQIKPQVRKTPKGCERQEIRRLRRTPPIWEDAADVIQITKHTPARGSRNLLILEWAFAGMPVRSCGVIEKYCWYARFAFKTEHISYFF